MLRTVAVLTTDLLTGPVRGLVLIIRGDNSLIITWRLLGQTENDKPVGIRAKSQAVG